MPSIYQRALGSDFRKLHPKIQDRFGICSADGVASVGAGRMVETWRGAAYTVPFLYLGAWRRIMLPEYGQDVAFTVENYAYRDRFGRETVTWIRTFEHRRPRRFDAYMIYSESRGCIVEYLGTHQHLAVDLESSVDQRGGLCNQSGEQRFYEGRLGFQFPLALSGVARVCEWYDDDRQRYGIEVDVTNRKWGRLFGYRGSFTAVRQCVPAGALPPASRPYVGRAASDTLPRKHFVCAPIYSLTCRSSFPTSCSRPC